MKMEEFRIPCQAKKNIMEQVQKPPIIKLEQVVLKGFGINIPEKTLIDKVDGEGIKKETRTF